MALQEYFRKRNFKSTPEPKGRRHTEKKTDQLMFVIHEHHASHLHYDFRLEWGGTLKSWAVPKGPSLDPHTKRLAVEVEDHPIEYGKFHGVIPENQYGGGRVYIWDTGTWIPEGNASEALKKGRLEFELKGKKLQGRWMLLRTKGKSSAKPQWLLIKRSDDFVVPGHEAEPDEEMKALHIKPKAKSKSRQARKTEKAKSSKEKSPEGFLSPALALLVDAPPAGKEWVHETKYDGYRILADVQGAKSRLWTRAGNDWSDHFPEIQKYLGSRKIRDAHFDGEVVWMDSRGRSDFQKLQNAIKSPDHSKILYYVFDLLRLNGEDLRHLPLRERKRRLEMLIEDQAIKGPIRLSDHSEKPGKELLKTACQKKWEGLVSKKLESPYPVGRNGDWVKAKCTQQQEFVIGGFTQGTGSRVGFGALLLGVYDQGDLRYVGKVGTGFTQKSLTDLKKKLEPLAQSENPFSVATGIPRTATTWVKPVLSAEITFSEWTSDHQLRVPVFNGLREDKPAREIHQEIPVSTRKQTRSKLNLKITHPDRIIFPEEALTKLDVAQYYSEIGSLILPYVAKRPLTLIRCPEGSQEACFVQKHISKDPPPFVQSVQIQEKTKTGSAMIVKNAKGLVSLVQMGALEFHCWNSALDDLEKPNQIIMDLDPDPKLEWPQVIEAALEVKEIFEGLGLQSFVKLSGGKGLHVQVPFQSLYDWDEVREFSKSIAVELENRDPDLYLSKMSKSLRGKKIFVDYLRNSRGATAVAPYCLRAKERSSVAMPLSWEELEKTKGPQVFSLPEAFSYLKNRKSDPWADYLLNPQKLPL